MKLNSAPPDPTQKMIFDWMPLIFTSCWRVPGGLVIYWAWNNLLSYCRQSFIMRRNGVRLNYRQSQGDVSPRRSDVDSFRIGPIHELSHPEERHLGRFEGWATGLMVRDGARRSSP